MGDVDPKMDFRYAGPLGDVEMFQITKTSRWRNQDWPDWLVMQKAPSDTNCVFTMMDKPDELWLANNQGEAPLPYLAVIVKLPSGDLRYVEADEFDAYTKVVPIPPPVVHPPADGPDAPPALSVVEAPVADDKLIEEVTAALELMVDGANQLAEDLLRKALSERTVWCNCTPGNCLQDGNKLGCRQHSPLL